MTENDTTVKLAHLPPKSRQAIEGFCSDLQKAFGANLISLLLYGSAARRTPASSGEDFKEGSSDINMVLIFEKVTTVELNAIRDIGRKYRKYGLVAPLIFKSDHIPTSLDTFPLEFSDMKENHICLYGRDPLESAQIEVKNLRHQCEVEFKGKLINLRRGFVQIPGDRDSLHQLMAGSINSILTACRGMIRLKGEIPPPSVPELLRMIETDYKVDMAPVAEVWKAKRGELEESTATLEMLFDNYLAVIKNLAVLVDSM